MGTVRRAAFEHSRSSILHWRIAAESLRSSIMSRTILLIHWNDDEAKKRVRSLDDAGFKVEGLLPKGGSADLRKLSASPPSLFLIDLSRLPSHGRAVAVALRGQKATRHVPIIFVDGAPEKVEATRALLPDATHTTWRHVRTALRRQNGKRIEEPVVPTIMAGYSGTPLPKKLGIKPGSTVSLMNGPQGFEQTLGALPEGATVARRVRKSVDLVLLFATTKSTMLTSLARAIRVMKEGGSVWIIWPKKASGVRSDLSDNVVRETGLVHGLVDFKVCAIDATWSGLRFARRRK